MRISISTWNRFHFFDLADQLNRLDSLHSLCSTLPRFKAEKDPIFNRVEPKKLQSYPYFFVLQLLLDKICTRTWLNEAAAVATTKTYQNYVKNHLANNIDTIDAYVGISGSGFKGGKYMVEQGKVYCFDRGSPEITHQLRVMKTLHDELSLPTRSVHPFLIENETKEAQIANAIIVPSNFCKLTYINKGFSADKINVIHYGADLDLFFPDRESNFASKQYANKTLLYCGQFSIGKGAHILVDYFKHQPYQNSRLSVVGCVNPTLKILYANSAIQNIDFHGIVPRQHVHRFMQKARALIFPSFIDGFGMVVTQALACGIPAIVSAECGASDIIRDGYNGFILDDISVQSIDLAIRKLFALTSEEYQQMSANCLLSVNSLGGWNDYGQRWYTLLSNLLTDTAFE